MGNPAQHFSIGRNITQCGKKIRLSVSWNQYLSAIRQSHWWQIRNQWIWKYYCAKDNDKYSQKRNENQKKNNNANTTKKKQTIAIKKHVCKNCQREKMTISENTVTNSSAQPKLKLIQTLLVAVIAKKSHIYEERWLSPKLVHWPKKFKLRNNTQMNDRFNKLTTSGKTQKRLSFESLQ